MSSNSERKPGDNAEFTPPPNAPNPFHPAALRIGSNFADGVGSREIITRAAVGRPSNQIFFRVHPDPEFQLDTAILDWQEDRQTYLVGREVRQVLSNSLKRVRLYYYITDGGVIGFWPVGLPNDLGRSCAWWDTAHQGAREAMTKWVRIESDNRANVYRSFGLMVAKDPPTWPELTMTQLLELAFSGRFIQDAEHPIVRRLMGRI